MKFLTGFFLLIGLFCSCTEEKKRVVSEETVVVHEEMEEPIPPDYMTDTVLSLYSQMGLVELDDPRIEVDLRYATDNNFMKSLLYDTLNRLFVQEDVAERLINCQDYLDSIQPGYHLKIFDGVRPLLVQREMWNAMDTIPAGMRGKFVSNPIYGSGHNYGASVDLTISDSTGNELDMGAGYDDFRDIAFPSKEARFLKSGELSKAQYENRKLLRRVMRSQKFYNIPSEWWHFNACTRLTAESRYEILLTESGDHKKWVSPKIIKDTIVDSLIVVE